MHKLLTTVFILSLSVLCLGCEQEKSQPDQQIQEESKTIVGFDLCDYIATEDIEIHQDANTKSNVLSTIEAKQSCSVVQVIKEDSKTYRIWAKIESPVVGWVCLKDAQNTYFMTETQYEQYKKPTNEYDGMVQEGLQIIQKKYKEDKAKLACIYAGYYPDEENGAYQLYHIGYYSPKTKRAYTGTYYVSKKYEISGFDTIYEISHHVNGVCMAEVCPGEKNKTYDSFGEVEAACINMRQAYFWDVLYEKEAVDQKLFEKNQQK